MELWGNIEKHEDGFYLEFERDDSMSNYTNAVVSYGVTDEANNSLEEIKEALGITDPSITDYRTIVSTFNQINFIDIDVAEPIFLPTYISSKIKYLATQYKDSMRLKSLLLSTLKGLEEPFMKMNSIKDSLKLETATGKNLELIGKIVGVNRKYCGDFGSTLNYAIQSRVTPLTSIQEVVLSDECLRKLIKVKIIKNSKTIVNYKELSEILSTFFEREINIRTCGDFSIYISLGSIDEAFRKCLILLRAFLPLPPTIKLYFIEDITVHIKDILSVTANGIQSSSCSIVSPLQSSNINLINSMPITSNGIQSIEFRVQEPTINAVLLTDKQSISSYGIQSSLIETKED